MKRPLFIKLEGRDKYQRLLSGLPQTAGMRAGYVTLKPGESVGRHDTGPREEAIIILSGRARICFSETAALVSDADTLIYIPPETMHDVHNIGKRLLRYVYVVSPTP